MNKSIITNFLAIAAILAGHFTQSDLIYSMGLFAFSGAITNWLAVHMLFEKVPGLYGSGVIPARFEEFKSAIRKMMMDQFFSKENLERFMEKDAGDEIEVILAPVIDKVDLSPSFDKLVAVIMESSFGGMLGMFGGQDALMPLREPFITNMKESLVELTHSDKFKKLVSDELGQSTVNDDLRNRISEIIEQRLNELTPKMVKEIVQEMIKEHLGWLVVWGGVFGSLIGALTVIINL